MPRPRIGIALVAASLLLFGACSNGQDKSEDPEPESSAPTRSPAPEEPATWPLTGLPVDAGQEDSQPHPILVVKIDNTSSSTPQVGLGSADLVVEELVEGGITRLAVFFYSKIPGEVGPVRSMRASDISIVPDDATMVTSGAANVTINRIKEAGIPFFSEGAKGFYRADDRSAPYNLMANLTDVASVIKQEVRRPADYLPFGDPADLPKGRPARTLTASFGSHSSQWSFQNGGYTNVNSYAGAQDTFTADNVLVLRVTVGDAGYRDPAGNPVPETKWTGTGAALLFHDGSVYRGTWTKDGPEGELKLTGKGGDLVIPPGRTWIELVPAATGDVTFK